MAGNKYNTPFQVPKPEKVKLLYTSLYDEEVTVEGTPKQIINQLLKLI